MEAAMSTPRWLTPQREPKQLDVRPAAGSTTPPAPFPRAAAAAVAAFCAARAWAARGGRAGAPPRRFTPLPLLVGVAGTLQLQHVHLRVLQLLVELGLLRRDLVVAVLPARQRRIGLDLGGGGRLLGR